MANTVISLTTIPSRMHRIGPTLHSLLAQDANIDAVILWVPEKYRRPEFDDFTIPPLADGIELRRCDVDYGPATKILPAVRAFDGQDVRIIYCDDDRIYHPGWAASLLRGSDEYPAECIAEAGEVVRAFSRKSFGATLSYQLLTKFSLGIYGHYHRRAIRALDPGNGPVDICKGYGGVLVRPEFISDTAFDIPALLWTVDDVWLSGQMAITGITIRKVARTENSDKTDLAKVGALQRYVHDGHGRHSANMECIRYFQDRHGIWAT